MSADRETIAFYDRDAARYLQHVIDHGPRESLIAFEATLPRHGDVLDLGCGGGQDSAWLRDRGHTVVSMDASAGLAREAKARFEIDVQVGDFTTLEVVAAFDGVWAAASLHHASHTALSGVFARIGAALRAGGHFAANMKRGVDRRDGIGRFYCAMDTDTARALLADTAVWTEVNVVERTGEGFDGVATPWLIISARRA